MKWKDTFVNAICMALAVFVVSVTFPMMGLEVDPDRQWTIWLTAVLTNIWIRFIDYRGQTIE